MTVATSKEKKEEFDSIFFAKPKTKISEWLLNIPPAPPTEFRDIESSTTVALCSSRNRKTPKNLLDVGSSRRTNINSKNLEKSSKKMKEYLEMLFSEILNFILINGRLCKTFSI